jgi:hypothetical protein
MRNREGIREPANLSEVLKDNTWLWVAGIDLQEPRAGEATTLWVCGAPTQPGHYPTGHEAALYHAVTWTPVHDGWREFLDTHAALGTIQLDPSHNEQIYGFLTAWPLPDFFDLDNTDSHYFMEISYSPDQAYIEPWIAERRR